MTGKLIRIDAY